ncbi:hypothetical protein V2G26_018787 [Clonostachys chloroleuca]
MKTANESIGKGVKVAIIGGGPAGLSAVIELGRLPFVDWHLYEQKPTISEIGTGITLQRNTWVLLEKLGASRHFRTSDIFRPADGHDNQYRNGVTGEVVKQTHPSVITPHQAPCRVHRGKLQRALLREVDQDRIRTSEKLVSVEQGNDGQFRLSFASGFASKVDLLLGADGIRSVIREFAFPNYNISYSGMTAYRAVVRASEAEQINGLSKAMIFWYSTKNGWIYTTPLDENDWEITCRIREPDDGDRSSWGKEVSVKKFVALFGEYCEPIQQLLSLVTRVKRFDYFGSRRLDSVVSHGSVALLGDASHQLSGAFGAGAAFAMEDAHVLAGAISWAASSGRGLGDALRVFDDVRSAHYRNLYQTLDDIAVAHKKTFTEASSVDEEIVGQINNVSSPDRNWMYYHNAGQALEDRINAIDEHPLKHKL